MPTPETISFTAQEAAAAKPSIEAQSRKQKQAAQPPHRGASKRQRGQEARKKHDDKVKLSEIETIEQTQLRAQREYRKKLLKQNIEQEIANFDEKIAQIADEKANVHSEIILGELRVLLMLREFKLLSKLEMKDY